MKTTEHDRLMLREFAAESFLNESGYVTRILTRRRERVAALLDDLDEALADLAKERERAEVAQRSANVSLEENRALRAELDEAKRTIRECEDVYAMGIKAQNDRVVKLAAELAECRAREERLARGVRLLDETIGCADCDQCKAHLPGLLEFFAALAPAPASREVKCRSEGHKDGVRVTCGRHMSNHVARGRDPSGGEEPAHTQAPDDAERAAREFFDARWKDRLVYTPCVMDLAALLRARDEAAWNAAVDAVLALSPENENVKTRNRIRALKKPGGPAR